MSALKIKNDQGNWINLPGLKGDKGDKGDKGESGVYLGTTAPSDEDINVWINPNGEAHTEAVVIDPTLTQEGQAADAKAVGDFKTATEEVLGSTKVTERSFTLVNGKTIQATSATITIVDASTQSVTNFIPVEYGQTVIAVKTGTTTLGNGAFFDENYQGIVGSAVEVAVKGVENKYPVPENASYVVFSGITARMAGLTVSIESATQGTIQLELSSKLDIYQGQNNAGKILAIGEDGNIAFETRKTDDTVTIVKNIPLFVSMMPDFFWVSSHEVSAFSSSLPKYKDGTVSAGNNAWFQISGNEGDSYVTIISGGNGDVSDITAEEKTRPFGCVIMYDDGRYYPCNAQYLTDNTFSVYPPLKEDITAGELAQIRTGIHLSRRGYRAYAQHLYGVEPKHCEKSKYIAKYRAETGQTTFPFTPFGTRYVSQVSSENLSYYYVNKLKQVSYVYNYPPSYSPTYDNVNDGGIEWEVNIDNKTGYVEFFVGLRTFGDESDIEAPSSDYALHCELLIDGVLTHSIEKTTKNLERICFDYSGGQVAKLKIYFKKFNLGNTGFNLNRITWWINEKIKSTGTKLIPTGTVVAQLFDSWGEFDDAESAVYLQKEINADAGTTIPYFNGSKSNQTSAWGKSWFFNKVWQNHPSIMITDFGINDIISAPGTSSLPSEIEGADGQMYDNIISQDDYIENMSVISESAINNNISPVFVGVGLPTYQTYHHAFIDATAKEDGEN